MRIRFDSRIPDPKTAEAVLLQFSDHDCELYPKRLLQLAPTITLTVALVAHVGLFSVGHRPRRTWALTTTQDAKFCSGLDFILNETRRLIIKTIGGGVHDLAHLILDSSDQSHSNNSSSCNVYS